MRGATEILSWTEKNLEYLITKADQAQENLLKKIDLSVQIRRQKSKSKKQFLERGIEQDAEASVANYIVQKQNSQNVVDIRLNEIQQDDSSVIEHEQQDER